MERFAIQARLGVEEEEEKIKAGEAIMKVFGKSEDSDRYCLASKFAAKGLDDFEKWTDIQIGSLKYGLPDGF